MLKANNQNPIIVEEGRTNEISFNVTLHDSYNYEVAIHNQTDKK